MKRCLSLTLTALVGSLGISRGQTLVDNTSYPALFGAADTLTVDPHTEPPPGTLLDLAVVLDPDEAVTGPLGTYWNATATGGADGYLTLLGLTARTNSTGAQVALTGDSLKFNIDNNPNTLLGALGIGLGLSLDWSATAKFNAPGKVVTLSPNSVYRVSFNVVDGSGLLNSTLGLAPTFGVELINGTGGSVGYSGGGSVANVLGLSLVNVGSGPPGTKRATAEFHTGATVPAGAAGVRFTGSAVLPATVLNLGTTFATVSNLALVRVDPVREYAQENGLEGEDQDPNADPDGDGRNNQEEYAQGTDPSTSDIGTTYTATGDPDGSGPQTSGVIITIPIRQGATFVPDPESGALDATVAGVTYHAEGSENLVNWNLPLTEVTPNTSFSSGLPTLRTGMEYRSFALPSGLPRAFLRVVYE